jgi:uncharacterized protein with GYD domain
MPKYLFMGAYNREGIEGVRKDGGTRRFSDSKALIEQMGGTLEAYYFAFGSFDFYAIVDLPDHSVAVAVASTVAGSGAISRFETVPLLTPADLDRAFSHRTTFRRPGG